MSVRSKGVTKLAELLGGSVSFNNLLGIARVVGVEVAREDFEALYGETWVKLVESVDWNRVLLEATVRHLELDHDGDSPCGECVERALLTEDTFPNWRETVKANG